MSEREVRASRAMRALTVGAAVVIVAAGLKAAGDVLLPVVFAGFLAVLAQPAVRGLLRAGVPRFGAIGVVVVLFAGLLAGITGILTATARTFGERIGDYDARLDALVEGTLRSLSAWGVDLGQLGAADLQAGVVMQLVGQGVNAVIGVLSRVVIVLILMSFMLLEASELSTKVELAFGTHGRPLGPFSDATEQVQRYLLIKSVASLATGILVGAGVAAVGLDFPVMWGLVAFLLNYIPTIGSIVAAIPPIALALVQLGVGPAVAVTAIYLGVNMTIGNFIEPRVLGRSLGLSPLVVLLSLLFWGWLWGPVGALFCVPMTVIFKLVLESNDDTRWIAVLLGSPKEIKELGSRAEGPPPAGA